MEALLIGILGTAVMFNSFSSNKKQLVGKNMGALANESKSLVGNGTKQAVQSSNLGDDEYANVHGISGRQPFQSCVDQQGAWISSNLLPKDTSNVSDDWSVNTPGNLEDKNFLEAGHFFGVDTIGSSHKNSNLQLRSEPIIPRTKISPFLNSSIMPEDHRRRFEIQDF